MSETQRSRFGVILARSGGFKGQKNCQSGIIAILLSLIRDEWVQAHQVFPNISFICPDSLRSAN